jgi:ABC-type uncharacterized transport system YnjBCD permease subunit
VASATSDAIGYAAALAVLVTFLMPTIGRLRVVAIASNILFCIYGYDRNIYPVLILHALLLPINIVRLIELRSNGAFAWRTGWSAVPGCPRATVKAREFKP